MRFCPYKKMNSAIDRAPSFSCAAQEAKQDIEEGARVLSNSLFRIRQ